VGNIENGNISPVSKNKGNDLPILVLQKNRLTKLHLHDIRGNAHYTLLAYTLI